MTSAHQALANALAVHQAGNLPQAEQLYREILRAYPKHDGALHSLGVLAWQTGDSHAALDYVSRACTQNPGNAEYQSNLAALLVGQQRWHEAEGCARRALALLPNYAEAHHNLSLALKGQGRLEKSVASCRVALYLNPDFAEAHCSLGAALTDQGQLEEAVACLQRAIQLRPNYTDALNNLSGTWAQLGRHEEAVSCSRQALEIQPQMAPAWNNLGYALTRLGRLDEAVAALRRALELSPDHVFFLNNLATALVRLGRFDETLACLERTLQLQPDYAHAYNNLCVVYCRQGEPAKALAACEQALRIDPEHADAHGNRALLWLQQGDFERGFVEFEWGWKCGERKPWLQWDQPLWDATPFPGRTLLLHAEQGLGDTLQFIRFIPQVKERGGTVIFQCQPALSRLLAGFPGIDRLITQDEPLPAFDLHLPLLSLPRVLGTTLDAIPADVPYLSVDLERRDRWKLSHYSGLKVGLCWQGNPGLGHDSQRSVRLEQFAPLAGLPGTQLLSVQKGPGSEQVAEASFPIADLGRHFDDFADTAAAIVNLDLIITVDTAVAHLAGALNVPVWVLVPRGSDWRWLLDRDDSPWYPSMRLFRQRVLNDWDEVFQRIQETLCAQTATPSPPPLSREGRGEEEAPSAPPLSPSPPPLSGEGRGENAPAAHDHNCVAEQLMQQGRFGEALAYLQAALEVRPDYPEALSNLGAVLVELRRPAEAIARLQHALRLQPNNPAAYKNLGDAFGQQGEWSEAIHCYQHAIRLQPDLAFAHNNLGNAYTVLGKLAEAQASYGEAHRLLPGNIAIYNNLGNAYLEDKKPDEAAAWFAEALTLEPHNAALHSNYAYCVCRKGDPVEAEKHIGEALRLQPDFADAMQNRAIILRALGRPEEALASAEQALRYKPDHAALHLFRAMVLLVLGRLEEGWPGYEARRYHKEAQPPPFPQPYWDGAPLGNRSLLIYAEQGLGDTLQFVRFLPLIKQRFAGHIILECQQTLYELLLGFPGIDCLIPHGEPFPHFDVHIPLLSLPGFLRTTLDTIPAPVPYLYADPVRLEQWRRELANVRGLKVGIAWQGRPTHGEDRQRSLPLSRFRALADLPGIQLFSLQKGIGAEQLAQVAFPIADLGQRFTTMSDTAAALLNLDLVISVDTSIVHLAGALGRPVWVALPFATDWRWLLEREDSPWYPTMRLFRQVRLHDWDDVFLRLRTALEEFLPHRGARR